MAGCAVAGIAFPFVLGAVADVVGIGPAAWLLPVTALGALAALLAWRGYARSDAAGWPAGERGDEVESCE